MGSSENDTVAAVEEYLREVNRSYPTELFVPTAHGIAELFSFEVHFKKHEQSGLSSLSLIDLERLRDKFSPIEIDKETVEIRLSEADMDEVNALLLQLYAHSASETRYDTLSVFKSLNEAFIAGGGPAREVFATFFQEEDDF